MVKGSVGQALVERYFEYAGWSAARTGVETVVDHLMQQRDLDKGELNRLPDLIVSKVAGSSMNPATHPLGQSFYVEVKTWTEWPADGADLSDYTRFGTVMVVWVSPKGLMATWLTHPGGLGNPAVVADPKAVISGDFRGMAAVGLVSFEHCQDDACESRQRAAFDGMAKALSMLPVA
jgi:hypothetical protein